jgi:hypothetical protein
MDIESEIAKLCSNLIETAKNSSSTCRNEIVKGLRGVTNAVSALMNRDINSLTLNIDTSSSSSSAAAANQGHPNICNPLLKEQTPQPGRPKSISVPVARFKTISETVCAKRTYDCPNNCGYGPYKSSSALSYHKKSCKRSEPKESLD